MINGIFCISLTFEGISDIDPQEQCHIKAINLDFLEGTLALDILRTKLFKLD